MKDAEKTQLQQKRGVPTVELPVALDGLAVYVHEKNPLQELSLEQLKKIYTGVVKNWKDVGGNDERIILYGRENSSGTYAYFKEHVLEKCGLLPDHSNASRHGGRYQRGFQRHARNRLWRDCLLEGRQGS